MRNNDYNSEFQAGRRWNLWQKTIEILIYIVPFVTMILFVFFYVIPQVNEYEQRQMTLINNEKRINDVLINNSKNLSLQKIAIDQESLINDVRQEVNNNIDKANLWLSFWLAVITIFCGFVPIIIQYRLYIINREKLQQEICYFRDFLKVHALHNIAENFTLVAETKIVKDSRIKDDLLHRFIFDAAEVFKSLAISISSNYNNILTPEIISDIIRALLQVSAMIEVVRKNIKKANRREFDKISDSISSSLSKINRLGEPQCTITPSSLISELNYLHNRILSLSRCIS